MFRPQSQTNVQILPGQYEPANLESRMHAAPIFDFSGSMAEHASLLPAAWIQMVYALCRNTIERLRIELACCVFDTNVVFQDFAPLPYYIEKPLTVTGGGLTALGTALLTVIDRTRQRRRMLASDGIYSRRAICPIITDGYASDHDALQNALLEMSRSEAAGEIEFVLLAPDDDCIPQLRSVFNREPIPLKDIDFDRFFGAFTRSLSSYSRSRIGHEPLARQLLIEQLQSDNQQSD